MWKYIFIAYVDIIIIITKTTWHTELGKDKQTAIKKRKKKTN